MIAEVAMTAPEKALAESALRGEGQRRCLVTRLPFGKGDLLRFVIDPEDNLVFDLKGDLPGRGYWVKADRAALEAAVAKGRFAKAARSAIRVPADLADRVVAQLRRQALDLIGLAKRSGQAFAGFEAVERRLAAGKIGLLIEAADAGADSRGKLARRAGPDLPVIDRFQAAELSLALGRDWAVHVAIAPGAFADRLRAIDRRIADLTAPGKPAAARSRSSRSRSSSQPKDSSAA